MVLSETFEPSRSSLWLEEKGRKVSHLAKEAVKKFKKSSFRAQHAFPRWKQQALLRELIKGEAAM